MIINNNSVEQINVALLDLEKKLLTIKDDKEVIDSLRDSINIVKASLNETKAGLDSGATYNINISGNATTATSATTAGSAVTAESAERASKDGNGDTITTTYQKKADMTDYQKVSDMTDYQKVSEKNAVAGYVKCNQTANGSYDLVATVNNGTVSYSWVARA